MTKLNNQSKTQHPIPSTHNLKPSTHNPAPSAFTSTHTHTHTYTYTHHPAPKTYNLSPITLHSSPITLYNGDDDFEEVAIMSSLVIVFVSTKLRLSAAQTAPCSK